MENFFDNVEAVDMNNVIYVFGDVETTGLSPDKGDKMTEIALIKTDFEFNTIDEYESFINPEQEITEKITELTGINNEMVDNAEKYNSIIPKIYDWIYKDTEGKKVVLVAHNAPFDQKFINHAGQSVLEKDIFPDFIDTVSLARELYPFWRNHKLDTCADKFGIINENHHRAMNDTRVLKAIGIRLINEALEDDMPIINFRTKKNLHYKK